MEVAVAAAAVAAEAAVAAAAVTEAAAHRGAAAVIVESQTEPRVSAVAINLTYPRYRGGVMKTAASSHSNDLSRDDGSTSTYVTTYPDVIRRVWPNTWKKVRLRRFRIPALC